MRIWVVLLCASGTYGQEHSSSAIRNPYNSPEDRIQGAAVFRSQCATCHGPDAKGGSAGPDLSRGQYKYAVSEEAMFRVISKGIPGTSMPGFVFNDRGGWQLVAFLRGLNQEAAGVSSDVARGQRLFTELQCARCHSGRAPNLSDAAARLAAAELRRALTDPDADVAPEYWQWRWQLKNGSTVEGRRMNEDTFSVQTMQKGQLRTISKEAIASAELTKKSEMPSFADKLRGTDLDCVVAYLVSLRGTRQ